MKLEGKPKNVDQNVKMFNYSISLTGKFLVGNNSVQGLMSESDLRVMEFQS